MILINYAVLLVGFVLLVWSYNHDIHNFMNRDYIISEIDGKQYPVYGFFKGENHAADMLAKINKFLVDVIRYMRDKTMAGKYNVNQREIVIKLLNGYNPDVLTENNPRGVVNTSYVLDKGVQISFCLREKQTGENAIHDFTTMKFVALHEITHVGTYEHGHGEEFWSNFKFLEGEAREAGLYEPIYYDRFPVMYCGILINYSPYYDNSLHLI